MFVASNGFVVVCRDVKGAATKNSAVRMQDFHDRLKMRRIQFTTLEFTVDFGPVFSER